MKMFKESTSLIKKRSYQYFLLRVEEKWTFNPFLSQCSHFKLSESTNELVFLCFQGVWLRRFVRKWFKDCFCCQTIQIQVLSFLLFIKLGRHQWALIYDPYGNHMFKVNNRNTRTRCEICSKLTIKTSERRLVSFWCLIVDLNIFHTLFYC